jgi:hypothetical protein
MENNFGALIAAEYAFDMQLSALVQLLQSLRAGVA